MLLKSPNCLNTAKANPFQNSTLTITLPIQGLSFIFQYWRKPQAGERKRNTPQHTEINRKGMCKKKNPNHTKEKEKALRRKDIDRIYLACFKATQHFHPQLL